MICARCKKVAEFPQGWIVVSDAIICDKCYNDLQGVRFVIAATERQLMAAFWKNQSKEMAVSIERLP